ncbi:MAG: hypothetical protein IT373_37340, partial [Polyangiaceae bacterium]|nr:hypothetical protein [Polyangiaceae bacterium]
LTTSTGGVGGAGGNLFTTGGSSQGGTGGSVPSDCPVPCQPAEVCSHGVCVPLSTCSDDDDCSFDTHCVPGVGCVPWQGEVPPHDPNCVQVIPAGVLAPSTQCEFSTAPANDPFPGHVDVQGTPIVVNFAPPNGTPSIAASFTATVPSNYTEDLGVIRVLRGDDCSVQANLGGVDYDADAVPEWLVSSASLAAGDLDGDGIAEIVAYGADGSTIAFGLTGGSWGMKWRAPYPAGAPWAPCDTGNHRCSVGWAGPSIHDLDDDGAPEVIREGVVFSAAGAFLSLQPATYVSYSVGLFPILANLDQDAEIELTNGGAVWAWQGGAWVEDPSYLAGAAGVVGLVAVADFGTYGTGLPPSAPELAIVRAGTVRIVAMTGEIVQGPMAVPSGGSGGPPTIADFDHDGLPEVGVAAAGAYTVYDLDCGASPRPGGLCPPGRCDYVAPNPCPVDIAWSRQAQDFSSNVTGSSVFDFEADGAAEVIYADECFVRVYDGSSGDVLFSQYRSSCTWYENPIIADVDGDFRAELVTPSNKACSVGGLGVSCGMLNADGVDILFNGLRCDTGSDCVSNVCDQGLCRCASTAQCCPANDAAACLEEGFACAPPNAGTAGSGNTCRSAHPHGVSGIRVYHDANDQWVRSRRIWNQHAYAVTHVDEDGTIPKTDVWANNWLDPSLNNFRQNVPGMPNGNAIGDATAGASDSYQCAGTAATMSVQVCNRGAAALAPGIVVGFYVSGGKVCETQTAGPLDPDECETVPCTWVGVPEAENAAADVEVRVDDGSGVTECKEGNNLGGIFDVFCKPPA